MQADRSDAEGEQICEGRLFARTQVGEIRIGEETKGIRIIFLMLVNADELPGMWNIERLEQDGIDDGKDRGIGPNAQCQRKHGDSGEARVLEQLAERKFEITHSILDFKFAICDFGFPAASFGDLNFIQSQIKNQKSQTSRSAP